MNRSIAGIISGLALAFVLAVPAPTYASTATFFGPIVPAECHCDNQAIQGGSGTANSAPDYGCVLQVVENLINFGITLSTILFTIYLVITGFSFITSAGSSEARSRAKTRFTNVFVGLVVLLCAWLVVDYVMKILYDQGKFGPWNGILAGDPAGTDHCIAPNQPKAITAGSVISDISTVAPGTSNAPGGVATGATGNSGLNVGSATQYIASHASATSGGYCARAVCNAVNAGGVNMGCANAYQLGSKLTAAGFVPVYSGVYSSASQTSFNYQPGDIVVFQPVPGHPYGHTAMYTGTQWISDFVQNNMDPTKNGAYAGASFTVYGP